MKQIIQHVAYGMNASKIPSMTDKQLIAAFFQADTNLPSIQKQYQKAIRHNMALIADEMSDRVDSAKGKRRIRLQVHLFAMQVIIKKFYAETVSL
jgi:hypothetical protein